MKNRTDYYAYRMLANAFRRKGAHLHTNARAVLRSSRFTKLKHAGVAAGCRPIVRGIRCAVSRNDMGYPEESAAEAMSWGARLTERYLP